MPRGKLRVYLGAAPGVGKTYDMLSEGHRRAERGTDVVLAYAEDYGRALTREMAEGLETVPRRTMTYRNCVFTEMDLDAVLARHPQVALVDELAHTNVPGSRHEKRWQDVEELLDAGIDVISTVNIQHLESLNDVVAEITGVTQRETVPDDVVRGADQIELVDMSAEALRRRMAHGNIYAPDKIQAALDNYFRAGNLTALREIALLWAADRVEEALLRYRTDHGIQQPWPTRERVLVALSGGPEGDALVRRGKRAASRGAGGELLAVHVQRDDALATVPSPSLERQRALVEELGGTYHTVTGEDPAAAILAFAREVNASHILIGATRRGRLKRAVSRGTGETIIEGCGEDIDVYVVTHSQAAHGRLLRRRAGPDA
ncbi:universal stress protein [Streptomyces sp. HPF1205]|uniref:universal stress protein n=1 Tax=Streptomyces sp. HPF1205 TaxID=2873262 RepID=UPI001CED4C49|nr:universal stress protein [Streptomyces sp. HPF1205]